MSSFARNKGQRAERKAIHLLQPIVDRVYNEARLIPPLLQRNTIQSDRGGFDVVGLSWLALEIKHCETLAPALWWRQTLRQAGPNTIPVLLYKANNVAWRARLVAWLDEGGSGIKAVVDISEATLLRWFEARLRQELTKVRR